MEPFSEAKVLVVDDEVGVMRLCDRFLTRAGYRVTPENEARIALDLLARQHFDLLLVDIRMPEFSGFEMMQIARQHQPDLAVVIMTGYGTTDTAVEALRQGADGMILKPFTGADLIQSVERALRDRWREREMLRLQALRPLFDITEALFREKDPQQLGQILVDWIAENLDCSLVGIYESQPGASVIQTIAGFGQLPSPDDGFLQRLNAREAGALLVVEQKRETWQADLGRYGLGSGLFVPVSTETTRVMFLAGRAPSRPVFGDADYEMLALLARQAVIALDNARLLANLQANLIEIESSQKALIQAEKMAAVGRLTASMAHEINNPLQAMQNCLHLAGRHELPLEDRENYLNLANEELERLMHATRRMLDFYRPSAVDRKAINVNDLIRKVLKLLDAQLAHHHVQVQTELDPELPVVMAVGNQIQQVILNLMLNAMEVMSEGGWIFIRTCQAEHAVHIVLEDTGPGISDADRVRLFEPFVSKKEKGLGLGLSVSYGIITAHGGSLEIMPSSVERGACFRISLPIPGM